jgi:hypothetical protein
VLPFHDVQGPDGVAVAVDGVGNVYVADSVGARVWELPLGWAEAGATHVAVDTIGAGLRAPSMITVRPYGLSPPVDAARRNAGPEQRTAWVDLRA